MLRSHLPGFDSPVVFVQESAVSWQLSSCFGDFGNGFLSDCRNCYSYGSVWAEPRQECVFDYEVAASAALSWTV